MDNCIFCKIIKGEIPANKVLENDKFMAFHDISPVTKIHVLVIPKNHVKNIADINAENECSIEGLFQFIRDTAKELGLHEDGYRVILNTGEKAGQTVHHMHAHILGGQELNWPGL